MPVGVPVSFGKRGSRLDGPRPGRLFGTDGSLGGRRGTIVLLALLFLVVAILALSLSR